MREKVDSTSPHIQMASEKGGVGLLKGIRFIKQQHFWASTGDCVFDDVRSCSSSNIHESMLWIIEMEMKISLVIPSTLNEHRLLKD